jgi:CBS domain-containing protein
MTRSVRVASPRQTIQEAARLMGEIDAGALPVGDDNRLVGMITDRDIALRAVGEGRGPDTQVGEVMSTDVKFCFDDEDTSHVCDNMGEQRLRRLPVVNRQKQLVGILSLGDIAVIAGRRAAGEALAGISQPGGAHSQTIGMR